MALLVFLSTFHGFSGGWGFVSINGLLLSLLLALSRSMVFVLLGRDSTFIFPLPCFLFTLALAAAFLR
jgi:hypothetical protein